MPEHPEEPADDSRPDESTPDDDPVVPAGENQPTSEKQIAANRRNAQKSKGPVTPEGKASSRMNRMTHGAYAKELHPFESGPYAEDASEFYERAERLIAGFDPEDELIAELAKRATDDLMKMKRLDAFEAAMAVVAGIPDPAMESLCGDLRAAEDRMYDMELIRDIVRADIPGIDNTIDASLLEETDWSRFAHLVRDLIGPRCVMPGIWDEDHKPSTNAEWEKTARLFLEAALPDPQTRWAWANGLYSSASVQHMQVEMKTKAVLAQRIMNGPMAALERPRAHLWREFNQAINQIRTIRAMRGAE